MMPKKLFGSLGLAALVLSGCLLPQPDTPIIPPGVEATKSLPQPGAVPAPGEASADQAATAADALISGVVVGATASAVVAVPDPDGKRVRQELASDGRFDLTLAPGTYRLEVVVGDRTASAPEPLVVAPGEERRVRLVLSESPLAVRLADEAPEEPATGSL